MTTTEKKKPTKLKEVESPKIKELEEKLTQAESSAKEKHDKLLYLHAELENFKKRNQREKEEFLKYSNEHILRGLLSIMDHLEKACSHSEHPNRESVVEGVTMTLKELKNLMTKHGVKEVESLGKPFDPHFHEAIAQQESDKVTPNHIITEHQKGYIYRDRLLRPARVVISKTKQEETKKEELK